MYQSKGESKGGEKAASGDQKGGSESKAIPLPVKETPSQSKTDAAQTKTGTEQPDPFKLRDLAAQEGMAFWAMWMVVAALATFLVTSFGTFLIWRQVKLTRQAVEDTGEATEAMREANKIAEGARDAQLRPYLYMHKPHIHVVHIINGMIGNSAEVTLHFKNFGQTPAKAVTIQATAFIGGVWNQDFEMDLGDAAEIPLGDMPPGFEKERAGFWVIGLEDAHAAIRGGDASVFIEGLIAYSDGGDGNFETQFRLASTGDDFREGRFTSCPSGNKST